jgi:hypothetical protein
VHCLCRDWTDGSGREGGSFVLGVVVVDMGCEYGMVRTLRLCRWGKVSEVVVAADLEVATEKDNKSYSSSLYFASPSQSNELCTLQLFYGYSCHYSSSMCIVSFYHIIPVNSFACLFVVNRK